MLAATSGAWRLAARKRVMHNPVEGNMPVSELTLPQDRDEAAPAEDLLALAYHDESDQAHVMNDRQRTCRAAASQGVVQGIPGDTSCHARGREIAPRAALRTAQNSSKSMTR